MRRASRFLASDGVPVPESTTTYDGLGRATRTVSDDLQTDTQLNPDGTQASVTTTPVASDFVGEPYRADRTFAGALGQATKKTLVREGSTPRSGILVSFDAAGRIRTQTDQDGHVTTNTYTRDGLRKLAWAAR